MPDNVEFALFEYPLDQRGKKIVSSYEAKLRGVEVQENGQKPIQTYFDTIEEAVKPVDEKAEEPIAFASPLKTKEPKEMKSGCSDATDADSAVKLQE